MQTQIINVQHPVLSQFIEAFIFFKTDNKESLTYSTFPNTNLCLAIYANNEITYLNDDTQNRCEITTGASFYKSRLYGFHNQPFQVKLDAALDQVCVLFRPGALKAFTNIPYEELLKCEYAFDYIFSNSGSFLEQIFNHPDNMKRAHLLEVFLLTRLVIGRWNPKLLEALTIMEKQQIEFLRVDDVSKKCKINPSTLYRLFYKDIGQSPKSFLQTIRFRKALWHVLQQNKEQLTSIAYSRTYYDQAHFNKDIKSLSGFNPGQLRRVVSFEQEKLAWVYNS
jgi:AraC-like DNA-binding protein